MDSLILAKRNLKQNKQKTKKAHNKIGQRNKGETIYETS